MLGLSEVGGIYLLHPAFHRSSHRMGVSFQFLEDVVDSALLQDDGKRRNKGTYSQYTYSFRKSLITPYKQRNIYAWLIYHYVDVIILVLILKYAEGAYAIHTIRFT